MELSLGRRQWAEVTSAVEAVERRIRYDTRMGRAPPLTESQLDEKLRGVGLQLEQQQRENSRQAVANTLGDGLGFLLLLCGFYFNRSRLRTLRTGIFARFVDLEVSTQAFILLLAADVTVGYHSSDGWVTFMELIVSRYNVDGAEDADNFIRLFVAVVPVCLDVSFKYWCYKYLRKLSPGTQIILGEIERWGCACAPICVWTERRHADIDRSFRHHTHPACFAFAANEPETVAASLTSDCAPRYGERAGSDRRTAGGSAAARARSSAARPSLAPATRWRARLMYAWRRARAFARVCRT